MLFTEAIPRVRRESEVRKHEIWAPGKPKESHRKTSATLSNAHANQQWSIHISLQTTQHAVARALATWTSASTSSCACRQPYNFKQAPLGPGLVALPRGCKHTATRFAAWLWFRSTFQALECWMLSRLCRTYSGENDGNCPAQTWLLSDKRLRPEAQEHVNIYKSLG